MIQTLPPKTSSAQAGLPNALELLTNAPFGIFTSTPEGRFLSANPALARMFGHKSPEELLASKTDIAAQQYADPADRNALTRLLEERARVASHECRLRRSDGSVFWVAISVHGVFDEQGEVVQYQGYVTDITERKQAESEVEATRKELSTILDSVPAMIWRKDVQGRYVHANKAFCDLVGIELDVLKGKSDFDVHPREIAKKYHADDETVISQGNPIHKIDERHMKASGQTGWSLTKKLPYFDENGALIGTIGFALDITDLKLMEMEQQQQASLIISLLDSIPDIISIKNINGVYLGCNTEFARHVGHRKEDVPGKTDYDLYPKDHADFCRDQDRLMLEHGKPVRNEEWISYPDGSMILVDTMKTLYWDADGNLLGIIGICRDISERKQVEEALQASEEKHRRLFETMTQGVVYHASNGAIISANPAAERILGLSLNQMQGKFPVTRRWKTFKEDGSEFTKADHPTMLALCSGETVGPVTLGLFNPDKNNHIWLSIISIPLFQPGETEPFQAYATFEDITERKRAEEALRKSESLFKKVFEILPIGLWIADRQGKLMQGNPAGVGIWGMEPKVGQSEYGVFRARRLPSRKEIAPDDWALAHTVNKGETIVDELLEIDAFDERKRVILNYTAPVLDGQGDVEAAIVVNQDITERYLAEEDLRFKNALLEGIMESYLSPIFSLDREYRYTSFNQTHAQGMKVLYGMDIQIGHSLYEYQTVAEDREKSRRNLDRALRGESFTDEAFSGDQNLSRVYIEVTHSPIRDERGQVIGVSVFSRDITDRRRAEEELRESEHRFKALHNASFGGITIHDKGIILECNQGLSDITGFGYDELIGMDGLLLIAEKSRELVMNNILAGYEKPYEAFGFRKNGEEYPVRLEARNISFQGKQVRVVEFRDITEQKQAEKALRLQSLVLNQIHDLVTITDLQGRITYVNQAVIASLGRTREEIIHHPTTIFGDDPEHGATQADIFEQTLRDGFWRGEVVNISKSGSRKILDCRTQVVFDENSAPVALCVIASDISGRKKSEQYLLEAKRQAEAASQAKSEFLANMSHEIRTPINGIMGMMQLLETTALGVEQRKYVQMATGSAKRLTRLLSDILDLSMVEAGKMTLHAADFMIREVADSVFDLFQVTTRDKDIYLECFIDPTIPSQLIGDEARVRQILFNLIGNAVKFTNQGSVRLETTCMSFKKPGECYILFSVSDTGIGIPDDKLDTLFKPFVQLDGSYTRSYQGAGLGLSIVKRLVDLMEGKISLVSSVGTGTTVHVLLPFKLPEGASIPAERESRQLAKSKQSLHILLAEDEPSSSFPTKKLLEKAGHTVTLAEDGQQCLDLLAAQNVDVILMDIQMPVMNGVEATTAIRSSTDLGPKKDIPIIALTAYAMTGDREKFLEAGMNDYLPKPVKMDDLAKALERVISSAKK